MAYSVSNPPRLIVPGVGVGPRIWVYSSVDALSLVRVAGYFTNGYSLGMRKNDIIFIVDNDASPLVLAVSVVNNATSDADVDIADGTTLASTDTD